MALSSIMNFGIEEAVGVSEEEREEINEKIKDVKGKNAPKEDALITRLTKGKNGPKSPNVSDEPAPEQPSVPLPEKKDPEQKKKKKK
ncbi:MAG: hypothetical protein UV51_C0016G0004 [Candidatus Woesebacteria bacterium GW2011_GWC1_42_9]|nr:MAG: hypothetical protein UV51_C0016G0004 [Candidatus Woesebacteria bacterium GW2011_GWC1_42_9]